MIWQKARIIASVRDELIGRELWVTGKPHPPSSPYGISAHGGQTILKSTDNLLVLDSNLYDFNGTIPVPISKHAIELLPEFSETMPPKIDIQEFLK